MDRAAYQRDYRRRHPGALERQQRATRARDRARAALAERHQAEYARLLEAERRAEGLPATPRPGRPQAA